MKYTGHPQGTTEIARTCPICFGADQHERGCVLEGKEHVYVQDGAGVDWAATMANLDCEKC